MILLQFSVAFIGIFFVQIWDILFQKTQKNAISFKKWWFSKQIKNRGKPRESGTGCRDAKASPKSKISNGFRQSITQSASHFASHSILTSYLHIVHVFLSVITIIFPLSPLQLFLFPCSGINCFYCG